MKEAEFRDCLAELVRTRHTELKNKIRRRFVNAGDAEDALQEAYARALEYWMTFFPEYGSFDSWFGRILAGCISQTVNFYRYNGTSSNNRNNLNYIQAYFTSWEERHSASIAGDGEALINAVSLMELIEKENPKHQIVLVYHFVHGLDPQNIIEWFPMKKKTVNMILYRFKKKLMEKFNVAGNITEVSE